MKLLFTILIIFSVFSQCCAQYKQKKAFFDTRDYQYETDDPYNPIICGVASYFIPGLGQIIAGETLRGLAFLGGYFGSTIITFYGLILAFQSSYNGYNSDENQGVFFLTAGLTSAFITLIWSIVDAVQVAKVNNLEYRYKQSHSINFELSPYLSPSSGLNNNQGIGLTLNLKF